ncbi:histidinol dehydrogenase [Opitutales bacterium ASA1]|uniref:histidinol dehydrogenase n=1 Tax=Congregicoccus parvus TaxID=3081749 RepID=UPI002B2E51EE|nr:histidinol dehydrogenase [Opitutales bacterium ASA1]
MRTIEYKAVDFQASLEAFCRTAGTDPKVREAVSRVLADVAAEGDAAVARYTAQFDGATLEPGQFRIAPEELAAAAKRLPAPDRAAIREAIRCVRAFNSRGLPKDWTARNPHGARIGEKFYPLARVGLYIPRGLASTVVMTGILAKIARVPQIAIFTPPDREGRVSDAVLGTAHLCGIDEVYRIGGVQAVGAMAYGSATIPAVVKVFGPGNGYVVEAKRQVFGTIGVDLLPGPSEVMVIADASADPEFVATDLLAQAEHGSGLEKVFLVSNSKRLVAAVHAHLRREVIALGPKAPATRVLENGFLTVFVPDLKAAAKVADWVAPEHLELEVAAPARKQLLATITTAGAIMQGGWSATALGDFTAGPSHELPTGRAGRFFSGLRVSDFLRRSSLVEYDERSLRKAAPVVEAFARMEKLDAHGRSVAVRVQGRPE